MYAYGLECEWQIFTALHCTWNVLCNTVGQFQTYVFVKANATQFVATGIGIGLSLVGVLGVAVYTRVAGSDKRNLFFYIGAFLQIIALFGLAMGSGSLAIMVAMIACYDLGTTSAGETTYKVWTQESFPMEVRASVQGFINGLSRFICGVVALFAPMLVAPERMQSTMCGATVIMVISALSGVLMIRMQKKYGIAQM